MTTLSFTQLHDESIWNQQIFKYSFELWRSLEPSTHAIDRQEKIHACVWRLKIASCKHASLKSTWFLQKKKIRSDIFITDLAYILHLCGVCSGGHIFLPSHEAGVAQEGAIFPVSFCLLLNDIPTPSLHTELAQYADDTALVATYKQPELLVKYLDAHLFDPEI